MSTTFYNTFSITISYGKNFGAAFGNQINSQGRLWPPKILAYLKTNVYRKNRMRSQRRLWPCVGRRPESDPAGGVFGNTFGSLTYSIFKYKHQNFYLVQTSFSEFVQ